MSLLADFKSQTLPKRKALSMWNFQMSSEDAPIRYDEVHVWENGSSDTIYHTMKRPLGNKSFAEVLGEKMAAAKGLMAVSLVDPHGKAQVYVKVGEEWKVQEGTRKEVGAVVWDIFDHLSKRNHKTLAQRIRSLFVWNR